MQKQALVTGASGGIGRVFAQKLAQDGYAVTVVARHEEKLKALTQEIGPGHAYVKADLSTAIGQDIVGSLLTQKKFDLLVNNAGVGVVGNFSEVSLEKQLSMFHLNCEALLKFSHVFLQSARKGDALINVSSALAFMPTPKMAVYCATKAFVTSLSDSLWFEQQKRGVYVMGLCPGITETEFQVNAGGRKEDLPKGLSQTAEEVVAFALAHLRARDKPTAISGIKNRMFSGLSRLLPRKAVVKMTGSMM